MHTNVYRYAFEVHSALELLIYALHFQALLRNAGTHLMIRHFK